MPLQIRRGTDAERLLLAVPLANGELLWTTDSKKLFIGDGTTIARDLSAVINYNDDDAQDAAGALIAAATTTDITFAYNSTTNALTASVSLSAFRQNVNMGGFTLNGAGEINIDGDILATGRLVGNYSGSLFGDDSQLLVDGVNSVIVGPIDSPSITGPLTGSVTGNLTGNVYGDIVGSLLGEDSTIIVDATNASFNTPTVSFVENNIVSTSAFLDELTSRNSAIKIGSTTKANTVLIYNGDDTVIASRGHLSSGKQPNYSLETCNGNVNSPTTLLQGDAVGAFTFRGYNGSIYDVVCGIRTEVGNISGGNVLEGNIKLSVITASGVIDAKLRYDKHFEVPGSLKVGSYATVGARNTDIPTPEAGMIILVTDADGGGTPKFQGYTGAGWVDLH